MYRVAVVAVCSFLLAWGAAGQNFFIIENANSPYNIVLDANASPSEQFAAEELQSHLLACTGIKLPIVKGSNPEEHSIILGCGEAARSLGVDPEPEELGEQGYLMRTVAPHLVIAGTPMAGTLYGVYDFLEESLGVRWHAPGETLTPRTDTLPLPQIDRLKKPYFAWRYSSYTRPGADAAFTARQRDNNGSGGPDHPFGVQHSHDGRCHSYFRYVSPGEFFDSNPEYFTEMGGVRRQLEPQLCLSNPEVLEIVTERMLARMAESPGVRQHNFSQMDYYNNCECAACTEINQKYGTMGGTQFWFVNELAERTSKQFPDKLIGTLAYMYTEEPPVGMKMHPNVAVWLCHMFPCCDSHPIATCPLNADYKRRAMAWSEICSHLYIWHYVVDFAHYYNPFPNFRAMAADMRFYRDIGAEGVYLQGMSHGGGGGEFSLLRPYYGMQLLWNPDQDPEAIITGFLKHYYGAAWEPIHRYITLLHDKVEQDNVHLHLYVNPAKGHIPDEILAQSEALFDEAEKAVAGDPEMLERVRVARMPLVYAKLFPRNGYTIKNDQLVFNPPLATMGDALEMTERMTRHGFNTLREMQGEYTQLGLLAALFNMPMAAPSIANAHLTVDAVPILGGRVLRILDKASGECVTAHNTTRSLFFPFCGGEEMRLGGIFMPSGMFEQYELAGKTGTSITLTGKVSGFDVKRTIELDPAKPILHITSAITNTSDKPVETFIRSHLELDMGEIRETRVSFSNRRGEDITRDMAPILAGLREGERYYDQDAPKGEWRFTGTKGLDVIQRFDDEHIDYTWLYAFPEDLNDLEVEVWTKRNTIEPGQSLAFKQEIEVKPVQP